MMMATELFDVKCHHKKAEKVMLPTILILPPTFHSYDALNASIELLRIASLLQKRQIA